VTSNSGWSPLNIACLEGHKEIVQLLLENDADVNSINKDGETPLHLASVVGHTEIVKLLLKNGAAVNVKDSGHPGTCTTGK
jgi:ankyrin repeat protein